MVLSMNSFEDSGVKVVPPPFQLTLQLPSASMILMPRTPARWISKARRTTRWASA